MLNSFRALLWTGVWISALALLGSFAGALHPLGDSLAVFRMQSAVATMALGGVLWGLGLRLGAVFVMFGGGAIVPLLWISLVPGNVPVQPILHYQKNTFNRGLQVESLAADIRISDADVVTFQELTKPQNAVLDLLKERLPTQFYCEAGGVAIATRWPLIDGSAKCSPGPYHRLVVLQVEGPEGPLWLASIHLRWPFPYGQATQLPHLLALLETLDGPVLLGGDFNMVPWSHALRQVAEVTGSDRVGRATSTFPRFHPWARLPIDHVFAPGHGTISLRPLLGSDHFGILARIALDAD